MADDALSQDEIEKLLAAHGLGDAAEPLVEDGAVVDQALADAAMEAALAAAAVAPAASDPVAELVHDALAGEAVPSVQAFTPAPAAPAPVVEAVELEQLIPLDAEPAASADIGMLLEVPLDIAVELGRTRLTIRELLELGQGSILELDRHAGEPVDVLVNGKALARGEVVVIDEEFGIRITDVVSQEDRLRSMAR